MRVIVSVDPGSKGGVAVAYGNLTEVEVYPLTELGDFIDLALDLTDNADAEGDVVGVVEDIPPYCGKDVPSSSIFKLGKSFGEVVGVLRALRVPVHLVRPKTWQKGLGGLTGKTGAARKRVLADHAKRLFPEVKVTLATADAVLLLNHFLNNR